MRKYVQTPTHLGVFILSCFIIVLVHCLYRYYYDPKWLEVTDVVLTPKNTYPLPINLPPRWLDAPGIVLAVVLLWWILRNPLTSLMREAGVLAGILFATFSLAFIGKSVVLYWYLSPILGLVAGFVTERNREWGKIIFEMSMGAVLGSGLILILAPYGFLIGATLTGISYLFLRLGEQGAKGLETLNYKLTRWWDHKVVKPNGI